MILAYSVFCFGCALMQAAANRTPSLVTHVTILDAPIWFSTKSSKFVVGSIALISILSEIILGFLLIGLVGRSFILASGCIYSTNYDAEKKSSYSILLGNSGYCYRYHFDVK